MKRASLLIASLLLLLIGVLGLQFVSYYYTPASLRRPLFSGYQRRALRRFNSNGERIYKTGISKRGIIPFAGGPAWLRMHGGGCASCHGEDGKGGLPIMMSGKTSPSITYKDLTSEHVEEGGEEHKPYTEELIKRAITKGVDSSGKTLDLTMPRWEMSEEDLNDLINYLKKLD